MHLKSIHALITTIVLACTGHAEVKHSYLVMGSKTAIISEEGKVEWEFAGGTRDGFVLPNGNVLLAFSDRVEEVIPAGEKKNQTVFSYKRSAENKEIGTTQRLTNGNTLITELGARPPISSRSVLSVFTIFPSAVYSLIANASRCGTR